MQYHYVLTMKLGGYKPEKFHCDVTVRRNVLSRGHQYVGTLNEIVFHVFG